MSTLGWGGPFGNTPWGGFTTDQFFGDFPEFAPNNKNPGAVEFTQSAINYWANIASIMLNADRWDDLLQLATELFVAHNLVLEALAAHNMETTGVPGLAPGLVTGKGAGDVSISYDTGSVLELNAGHWNYTIYGKRFMHLANMVGAGPVQVMGWSRGGGGWMGPPTGLG